MDLLEDTDLRREHGSEAVHGFELTCQSIFNLKREIYYHQIKNFNSKFHTEGFGTQYFLQTLFVVLRCHVLSKDLNNCNVIIKRLL
jgi:repressor of nif and glnA expression